MNTINMKEGETWPPFRVQILEQDTENPIDVTGGTVTFSLFSIDGSAVIEDASGTVDVGATGLISYTPDNPPNLGEGIYNAEFKVNMGSDVIFKIPKHGYIVLVVEAALTS